MKSVTMCLLALCSMSMVGACADEGGGPAGPEVAIEVAPLTLPGVVGVEYAIAVFNAEPIAAALFTQDGEVNNALATNITALVWGEGSVTSNQFGNAAGGDISYVGPCDASVAVNNYVALALLQVNAGAGNGSYDGDLPFGGSFNSLDDQNTISTGPGAKSADTDPDFTNPCTYLAPCVLEFECIENADVSVVFNLAIMRDANQGFFDIAVNFEDIFCSSKYDTCYPDGSPITLLFGDDLAPEGPGRDTTGVFAMACTTGPGDPSLNQTEILMSRVVVSCPGVDVGSGPQPPTNFVLTVAGLPGNHDVSVDFDGAGELAATNVQYATYYGAEDLDCGVDEDDEGIECNKAYLNIAINLEDLPPGCTLSLQATAQNPLAPIFTDGTFTTTDDQGTLHPFVNVVNANLSAPTSPLTCTRDPFNESPAGSVNTFYGSNMLGGESPQVMCVKSTNGLLPTAIAGLGCGGLPN